MNKQTTINENILETIKTYAEIENKTQVDFTNELLTSALRQYFLKRSGGAVFTVPNPQLYNIETPEGKSAVAESMELAIKFSKNNIHVGLGAISNFLETRLFIDTESERKKFRENIELDNK